MTPQGEILRFFIEKQKINKTDIAKGLTMSRQNLYQLFTSNSLLPETIEKIEKYLKVTWEDIDIYFKNNIDTNVENQSYTEKRRKQKITSKIPMAPLIPIKAQAGYVKAIDQQMYIETMEQFALPPGVNPHGANWAYWEIEGNSMEPVFKQGDIILTSQVHQMDWENLRNFYIYVVVTDDRVLFKRVYCKNQLEWVLISENEEQYPQQLLSVEYIKQVWVYRRTIKTDAAPTKEFDIKV
jgi:phage repressor protein C with HTH and peptisase S24 domain